MALLLRLAAALDRRPAAVVGGIRVEPLYAGSRKEGPTGLTIALEPFPPVDGKEGADLSLERWSLASCREVVLEACGLSLRVLEQS
jgi:exopolyphosphatase/guanosine-5'-triphosphate,3'-diphosphate pyrophosphatase